MLNHILENQCHKPRNKKNTFLALKVGKNGKKYALKPNFISIIMFLANPYDLNNQMCIKSIFSFYTNILRLLKKHGHFYFYIGENQ